MKAIYVQKGENLDYKNVTGSLIEAGSIVVMGSLAGVAGTSIPEGEIGSIHMTGVFKMPKKAGEAISAGTKLFYTEEGLTAVTGGAPAVGEEKTGEDAAVEAGLVTIGYSVMDAAAEDTDVTVRIG